MLHFDEHAGVRRFHHAALRVRNADPLADCLLRLDTTAAAVCAGLDTAALDGTGRQALHDPAAPALTIQTGTAGFFRPVQWLVHVRPWRAPDDRIPAIPFHFRIR